MLLCYVLGGQWDSPCAAVAGTFEGMAPGLASCPGGASPLLWGAVSPSGGQTSSELASQGDLMQSIGLPCLCPEVPDVRAAISIAGRATCGFLHLPDPVPMAHSVFVPLLRLHQPSGRGPSPLTYLAYQNLHSSLQDTTI